MASWGQCEALKTNATFFFAVVFFSSEGVDSYNDLNTGIWVNSIILP